MNTNVNVLEGKTSFSYTPQHACNMETAYGGIVEAGNRALVASHSVSTSLTTSWVLTCIELFSLLPAPSGGGKRPLSALRNFSGPRTTLGHWQTRNLDKCIGQEKQMFNLMEKVTF
jgi:hypothetical protein